MYEVCVHGAVSVVLSVLKDVLYSLQHPVVFDTRCTYQVYMAV
jgi:hypothetical protein